MVSTRPTTLLQTASRSEVCSESYEASKSRESRKCAISGLPRGSPGSPGTKWPFGCHPRGESQGEPLAGRGATAPSVIREIEKVQGGEQAPRDGSLALPKDMIVEPFGPKGLLNV